MDSDEQKRAARRLELAIELFAVGEDLKRQQLRREHPEASEAEIETMIRMWLRQRPGAEHGDAVGRVCDSGEIFG